MRDGVDCIAAVTDRHAESVLIKGLRLQRQRAQGPALPPPKLQKHQKEGKRDYTASCGACRKPNTRASEREKKRVLRKEKRERGRKKEAKEVCKGIQREKTTEIWEEFERGSLVWQRRGFCIVRI